MKLETVTALAKKPSVPGWIILGLIILAIAFKLSPFDKEMKHASAQDSEGASRHEMKLERFWRYEVERFEGCGKVAVHQMGICGTQYFHCDYTAQTCQSGYQLDLGVTKPHVIFLYELLAADRKTVLAHLFCNEDAGIEECMSFDTGEGRGYTNFMVTQDMPENCVDFTRERIARIDTCNGWISANTPAILEIVPFPPPQY
jgi:hypothetical protein